MPYPPPSLVWYLLLDSSTGKPYKGANIDYVSLPPTACIAQFRDAVHLRNPNKLSSVVSADLLVYKNKSAFVEGQEKPLRSSYLINDHGKSEKEEDMLVVVVAASRSTSESRLRGKEADSRRKQRWIEPNEILEGNAKRFRTNESTTNFSVNWNQLRLIKNTRN